MFGGHQGIPPGEFKARINSISAGGAGRSSSTPSVGKAQSMTKPLCLCEIQRKSDAKKK